MMAEERDFTVPWNLGDVIFRVEDKDIYANKAVMSLNSPVMEKMFTADFKEKTATEIPLPEKNLYNVIQLMRVLHPPHKEITDEIAERILPLTHEYEMHHFSKRCGRVLLEATPNLLNLVMIIKYDMHKFDEHSKLYKNYIDGLAATLWLGRIDSSRAMLTDDVWVQILRSKVKQYEQTQMRNQRFH